MHLDEWKNKLVFLEFDGVYHNAVLWINGKFAARHPNGYTPFWREITEFVKPGENHIRFLPQMRISQIPDGILVREFTGMCICG